LIEASSEQMNDKMIRAPLGCIQSLYDFQGADRLVILLEKTELTDEIRDRITEIFRRENLDLEIKTWVERSQWYRKVKEMFDLIFLFLFTIVFIIVVMSIVNTMSMAVLERTREIGTLRALGLKRKGVMLLFALEAGLIGVGGTISGIILAAAGWLGIEILKPTWVPPGTSHRIPLKIEFVPEFIFTSFAILMVLCVISSLLPARNAARRNVIDALGHV
jgi:putative ABC transport system permease protein